MYPTRKQAATLQWTLDRCRELYNAALQERREAYKYARKSISAFEQMRSLTEIKAEIRPEYQQRLIRKREDSCPSFPLQKSLLFEYDGEDKW